MASYLRPLTQLVTPTLINLGQDGFVDEIVERIKANPDWNSIWDGELLQNASYAFINYFAYLFSKGSEASNRTIRESFLTLAKDPKAIITRMNDFGVNLQQNTASVVTVTGLVTNGALTQPLTIVSGTQLQALSLDGDNIVFEIIKKDVLNQSKWDYEADTIIDAGVDAFEVTAYAGQTKFIDVTLNPPEDLEKFTYTIADSDIIENSIRVYYEFGNPFLKTELIETSTFVVPQVVTPAFPNGVPHYKIKYFQTGAAQIIFGTSIFGGAFNSGGPSNIRIFYRVGGGRKANINIRAISQTLTYTLNTNNTTAINFVNLENAVDGKDRESIYEARYYAPYRIGRNASIVSDFDVLNEFSSRVYKHRVDSPKYSEISNSIPILHYWNFVIPKRFFSQFVFPLVSTNDTVATYTERFLLELNTFMNLRKIHDQLIEEEIVTFFNATNFNYTLEFNPPLNGTLTLSAYDHTNEEVDRIKFTGNYAGLTNDAALPEDFARVTCDSNYSTVTVITGLNDQLRIAFDEEDPLNPGTGAGDVLTITIAPGLYGTAEVLANEIDIKIKAASAYLNAISNTYCFVEANKIIFESGITGQYSRVEILDVANSINDDIDIGPRVGRALPTNGSVFLPTTNYNYEDNQVEVKLNTDRYDESRDFEPTVVWPDVNSPIGPSYATFLQQEIGPDGTFKQAFPIVGEEILVRAINSISNVIIDEISFQDIIESTTNTAVITSGTGYFGTGNVFDTIVVTNCNYNYTNSQLTFKLLDSILGAPPYTFPPGYDSNLRFEIIFKRKTYRFITANYYPNPYINEDESLEFVSILRGTDKRMIGVEPILKRVEFIPYKVQAVVIPKRSRSPSLALNDTKNLILERFGYDNTDPDINIGTGLSSKKINGTLNETVTLNPNVQSVELITPLLDIEDNSTNQNRYYFVLPEEMILRMSELEANFPQIAGFTDQYRISLAVG